MENREYTIDELKAWCEQFIAGGDDTVLMLPQAFLAICKKLKEHDDFIYDYRPISSVKMGFETGLTSEERFLLNKTKIKK